MVATLAAPAGYPNAEPTRSHPRPAIQWPGRTTRTARLAGGAD